MSPPRAAHSSPARVWIFLCPLVLAALIVSGCSSTSPSGARVTVSETIENKSLSDIRLAMIRVFQKHGYATATAHGRTLVFERMGDRWTRLAYGTWMSSAVWVRVKVDIVEARPGVNVLNLNVFRVTDKGDPSMEEETYFYGVKRKPFQAMLSEIKADLGAAAKGN